MDYDILKSQIETFLENSEKIDTTGGLNAKPIFKAEFINILEVSREILSDHEGFIASLLADVRHPMRIFRTNNARAHLI